METNIKLKEIKINSSIKKYELKTTLLGYGNKGLPGTDGKDGKDGKDGINGATFTPSVDNEGNLSWTNNGNLDNPETKNIKGPKGDSGEGVPSGGTTGQVLKKKSNNDYDTEWVDESGGGSGGTSDYTDLNNKPKINNVELSGNKSLSDLGITNFSGDYNDLSNKPDIPTKTSDLTNDSGFIDSSYHDNTKQDTLVSGTNIKTINNESILGEGNISISGGSSLNNVLDGNAIGSARTIGANDSEGLPLGEYAWAEGQITTAYGKWSHAEGYNSAAQGNYSHAEGYGTMASSNYSHAEGSITTASGNYSHAEGLGTKASSNCSHAQGKYNISDTSNEYAHIVGNGNSSIDTSNAHTIDWQGNAWFSGDVYVRSTSGKNKDDGSKKLATEDMVNTSLSNKQDTLVSGQNIKTINNESILGSGNLAIAGGAEIPIGPTPPENPQEGDFWIDTSANGETYGDTLPIGAIVEYSGTTVPQGYEKVSDNNIIESGSNDNGNWIKYNDGTMICTKKHTGTANVNVALGSIFYNGYYAMAGDLPQNFIEAPYYYATNVESEWEIWGLQTKPVTTSKWATRVDLMSATSQSDKPITITMIAIGKWK